MNKHAAVIVALSAFACSTTASADSSEKYVGTGWVWFTDYIYLAADWTLEAAPKCDLEVGIGVSIAAKPRGGITRFNGHYRFTTYGLGSIHVRAIAGETPCLVRLSKGTAEAVGVYSDPSVIKSAIRDGKIIYQKVSE